MSGMPFVPTRMGSPLPEQSMIQRFIRARVTATYRNLSWRDGLNGRSSRKHQHLSAPHLSAYSAMASLVEGGCISSRDTA